jgi:hypothetical protein
MKSIALPLVVSLFILGVAPPAAAHNPGYHVVWDDFSSLWSADTRWLVFSPDPSYSADDAIVTTSPGGLSARSRGTNPITGEPAFMNTVAQGPFSAFDHAKWLVIMNHFSSRNLVGFDAVPGHELSCEATVSGRVYGAAGHPFQSAAPFPDADPRLGAVATSAFDPETFVIFNFLLTNEVIYAFYERPAFARPLGDEFAAFAFAVPVLPRFPSQTHHLRIAYDRAHGRVRWLVDGWEVFRLDTIGSRIDRRFMLIDRGGADEIVNPAQIDCGMAMFDFLDGYGPTGRGLVQIDADDDTYFNPRRGAPHSLGFVDPLSDVESRLFGQGASMNVRRFIVSSLPTDDP